MRVLTAAVQLAWPVVIGVRDAGIEVTDLLEPIGLEWDEVRDPVRRLPYEQLCRLWDRGAELTQDPSFGLRVVSSAPTGTFGVLEYLIRNSSSLAEKISYYERFQRLYQDASEVRLSLTDCSAALWYWQEPGTPTSAPLSGFALACCVQFTRQVSGVESLHPDEVWFYHGAPADVSAHEKLFRCRLRFDAPTAALIFPPAALSVLQFKNDTRLRDVLEDHASRLMTNLPPKSELLAKAGRVVRGALEQGVGVTPEDLGKALGMSARTLRRRLAEEGTAFQSLLDSQRSELALRYLEDPDLTSADVAERLRFSDAKSFTRAFRRWTGMSPRDYRAKTSPI